MVSNDCSYQHGVNPRAIFALRPFRIIFLSSLILQKVIFLHIYYNIPYNFGRKFGLPKIWSPKNLVSQKFGLPKIWSPKNLVSQKFGLPKIWSPKNLVSQKCVNKSAFSERLVHHNKHVENYPSFGRPIFFNQFLEPIFWNHFLGVKFWGSNFGGPCLGGTKFLGDKIFGAPNFWGTKLLGDQIFGGPNYWGPIFWDNIFGD